MRPIRSIIFWVTVAACVASIAVNGILAYGLSSSFEKLQHARVFPLGYVHDTSASPAFPQSTWLAVYGDSRAYLWPIAPVAGGREFNNLAHGGVTSSQLLLQLQTGPVTRSTWAVLQIGINDLHSLGVMLQDAAVARANLQSNLRECVRLLKLRSDYVVVTTIFPPSNVPLMRRQWWDARTPQYIDAVNSLIGSLADGERVWVLDADRLLRGPDGRLQSQYEDADFFLHLNTAGYALLNESLQQLMSQVADAPDSPG